NSLFLSKIFTLLFCFLRFFYLNGVNFFKIFLLNRFFHYFLWFLPFFLSKRLHKGGVAYRVQFFFLGRFVAKYRFRWYVCIVSHCLAYFRSNGLLLCLWRFYGLLYRLFFVTPKQPARCALSFFLFLFVKWQILF